MGVLSTEENKLLLEKDLEITTLRVSLHKAQEERRCAMDKMSVCSEEDKRRATSSNNTCFSYNFDHRDQEFSPTASREGSEMLGRRVTFETPSGGRAEVMHNPYRRLPIPEFSVAQVEDWLFYVELAMTSAKIPESEWINTAVSYMPMALARPFNKYGNVSKKDIPRTWADFKSKMIRWYPGEGENDILEKASNLKWNPNVNVFLRDARAILINSPTSIDEGRFLSVIRRRVQGEIADMVDGQEYATYEEWENKMRESYATLCCRYNYHPDRAELKLRMERDYSKKKDIKDKPTETPEKNKGARCYICQNTGHKAVDCAMNKSGQQIVQNTNPANPTTNTNPAPIYKNAPQRIPTNPASNANAIPINNSPPYSTPGQATNFPPRGVQCQFCGKIGHMASQCYKIPSHLRFQPQPQQENKDGNKSVKPQPNTVNPPPPQLNYISLEDKNLVDRKTPTPQTGEAEKDCPGRPPRQGHSEWGWRRNPANPPSKNMETLFTIIEEIRGPPNTLTPPDTTEPVTEEDSSPLQETIDTHKLVGIKVMVNGQAVYALLDSGASSNFLTQKGADHLQIPTTKQSPVSKVITSSGHTICTNGIASQVKLTIGTFVCRADFVILDKGPAHMILGLKWGHGERVRFEMGLHKLTVYRSDKVIELPVKVMTIREMLVLPGAAGDEDAREDALEARRCLEKAIAKREPEEGQKYVRPVGKKYQKHRNMRKRIDIDQILDRIKREGDNTLKIDKPQNPLETLYYMREIRKEEEECMLCRPIPPKSFNVTEVLEDNWIWGEQNDYEFSDDKLKEFLQLNTLVIPHTISEIVLEFNDAIPDTIPPGLPPKRELDHGIPTVAGKIPPLGPRYNLPLPQRTALKQQMEELKKSRKISYTDSQFAAPCIMVPKKTEEGKEKQYRMVIDYRQLNAITITSELPPPTILEIIEKLKGAKVFSTMDLEQGFHQIRMAPDDMHKTGFRNFMGHYEYKVMPFGLRGAPGTFQALMNIMLFEEIDVCALAYLDDILVYSPTMEQHAIDLRRVFEKLRKHKFYVKISKCKFAVQELEFLGFQLTSEGIRPSPSKIDAVRHWPEELKNDTQVKQFMGTVNYCKMFMGPHFATIAAPLWALTKKDVPFNWGEEQRQAMKKIKQALIDFTTLQIPDCTKPFLLRTDASGTAVGAVLSQEDKPVGFMSKSLNGAQLNYCVYDKEFLAIITALKQWEHLLRNSHVTVETDHKALTYLQHPTRTKQVRNRVAKYLDYLADFPYLTLKHLAGKSNCLADFLSRQEKFTDIPADMKKSNNISPEKREEEEAEATVDIADGEIFNLNNDGLDRGEQAQMKLDDQLTGLYAIIEEPSKSIHVQPINKQSSYLLDFEPITPEEVKDIEEDDLEILLDSENEIEEPENYITTANQDKTLIIRKDPEDTVEAYRELDLSIGSKDWVIALEKCEDFSIIMKRIKEAQGNKVEMKGVNRTDTYEFFDNILKVRILGLWRTCIPSWQPNLFRRRALYTHHDSIMAGHVGEKKTIESLAGVYYWPSMRADAKNYVASCIRCRTSKSISMRYAGLLQPLDIPNRRWASISMDFITGLPLVGEDTDSIMVVVDRLSKMAHFIPCSTTNDSEDISKLFMSRIVAYHGLPDDIVCDRDAKFTSVCWKKFTEDLGIKVKKSTAFHPMTDGQTERTNRTIEQMLRCYIQTDETKWIDILPLLELAYNCARHESVGMSPFEVMIGEKPLRGIDEGYITWDIPVMDKWYQSIVMRATAQIYLAQRRQKRNADKGRREVQFEVGDKVWLSTRNLNLPGNRKFTPNYAGPYEVLQKIGKVAYLLKLPRDWIIHPVFHVSLLAPFTDSSPEFIREEERWEGILDEDGIAFEVEEILDRRDVGTNKEYLVRWRGYTETSWVQEEQLDGCKTKLRAFNRNFNKEKLQEKLTEQRQHITPAGICV
ncbi:MAG: reverse transcriptase domain-containing protein [Clostridium sp.]|uniref:reverse transcriptase domain-containing protein n=1 Tax=Clostridium sp. TaxID=1506 RepID=UPI003F320953